MLLKNTNEMIDVIKTRAKADLRDRMVRMQQKVFGVQQPVQY